MKVYFLGSLYFLKYRVAIKLGKTGNSFKIALQYHFIVFVLFKSVLTLNC